MIVPLIYCSRNRKDLRVALVKSKTKVDKSKRCDKLELMKEMFLWINNLEKILIVKMMLREGIDLAKKQGKQLLKQ